MILTFDNKEDAQKACDEIERRIKLQEIINRWSQLDYKGEGND